MTNPTRQHIVGALHNVDVTDAKPSANAKQVARIMSNANTAARARKPDLKPIFTRIANTLDAPVTLARGDTQHIQRRTIEKRRKRRFKEQAVLTLRKQLPTRKTLPKANNIGKGGQAPKHPFPEKPSSLGLGPSRLVRNRPGSSIHSPNPTATTPATRTKGKELPHLIHKDTVGIRVPIGIHNISLKLQADERNLLWRQPQLPPKPINNTHHKSPPLMNCLSD
jgi:hypothetical protein